MNLLDNAIKFTDRGTIRLTVHAIDRPNADGIVRFAVEDTGIGMAPAEMDRLFEPFYRIRSMSADGPAGTGLGLAICQRLARRLGGEIAVESTPGKGSIFTLSIASGSVGESAETPEVGDVAEAIPRVAFAAPSSGLHARILVTDDNEANQQLIGLRLIQAGAEVVTALNGKEALDRAAEAANGGVRSMP